MTGLLPGKVILADVVPTFGRKESRVAAKIELQSTCGCPVNEATLLRTEQTGKPSDVSLTQVGGVDQRRNKKPFLYYVLVLI